MATAMISKVIDEALSKQVSKFAGMGEGASSRKLQWSPALHLLHGVRGCPVSPLNMGFMAFTVDAALSVYMS